MTSLFRPRFMALLWCAWLGCAAPPEPLPPLSLPPPLPPPTTPPTTPPAASASATAAAAPAASAAPRAPAGLDGEPMTIEARARYRDKGALCADHVARSRRALAESGGWAHLKPTRPSCRETKLPVPFRGDATFRAARAFALDSGLSSATYLVVELPDGLALTPISWAYLDIHASAAVPLPGTLESVAVDNGALIAVVGRTEGTRAGSGGPEMALVRGAAVCRVGGELACRAYFPEAAAPLLGLKRRPWEATTPWEELRWDRSPAFTFSPSGRLVVGE